MHLSQTLGRCCSRRAAGVLLTLGLEQAVTIPGTMTSWEMDSDCRYALSDQRVAHCSHIPSLVC